MTYQTSPTICAHNAPGQVVVANVATTCRQCGAQIKASSRAVDAASGAFKSGGQQVNAVYPGDGDPKSATHAFGK
jgi:hypothetical protein